MAIRPTTPQSSADWDRMRDPENPQPPPAEAPLAERLRAWAREVDTDIDNLAPGWWQTEKGVPVTEKVQAVVTKVGSVWDKEVQPELDEHLPSVAKFTAQPPNLQVMQGGAAIGAVGAGIAVITGASIAVRWSHCGQTLSLGVKAD